MKKTIIIATAVLLVILVATLLVGAGKQTKKLDADYDLSFMGRTAICQATVTGERKNDFIQVTMRLKQEDVIWKTWYKEGYFQVAMEGSCKELIKNKVYTLEVSATINGEPQEVFMVRKACAGVVPTEPTTAPTAPTAPTTIPTTAPTAPTTQPTIPPTAPPVTDPINPHNPKYEGYSFVYQGHRPSYIPAEVDLSGCTLGYFYWLDEGGTELIPVVEEEIFPQYDRYLGFSVGYAYCNEDGWLYYVKTSESNKIYRTCRGDFSQHELIYESEEGSIVDLTVYPWLENYLQFVENNKKFVVLDLNTGEKTVLMEMYYVTRALVGPGRDGEIFANSVSWSGKPTEDGDNFDYIYFRDTGEIWEDPL